MSMFWKCFFKCNNYSLSHDFFLSVIRSSIKVPSGLNLGFGLGFGFASGFGSGFASGFASGFELF